MNETKYMIGFTVPGRAVSVNSCYAHNRQGMRFLTKEGKAFKESIQWLAKMSMSNQNKHVPPQAYTLSTWEVRIHYYFENPLSDIDGPTKLVMDALEKIFYFNDNRVVSLPVKKSIDKENPRIEIVVQELEPCPWAS